MLVVIVTVCEAFGLTVSETKTEKLCLRTRGMPDAATTFSVEAAGQVCTNKRMTSYTSGGMSTTTHTKHVVQLPDVLPLTVRPTECSS